MLRPEYPAPVLQCRCPASFRHVFVLTAAQIEQLPPQDAMNLTLDTTGLKGRHAATCCMLHVIPNLEVISYFKSLERMDTKDANPYLLFANTKGRLDFFKPLNNKRTTSGAISRPDVFHCRL